MNNNYEALTNEIASLALELGLNSPDLSLIPDEDTAQRVLDYLKLSLQEKSASQPKKTINQSHLYKDARRNFSQTALDLFALSGYIHDGDRITGNSAEIELSKLFSEFSDELPPYLTYGNGWIVELVYESDTNETINGQARKMQIGSDPGRQGSLPSEFRSGFKTAKRLNIESRKIKGYILHNCGNLTENQALDDEFVPFVVRHSERYKTESHYQPTGYELIQPIAPKHTPLNALDTAQTIDLVSTDHQGKTVIAHYAPTVRTKSGGVPKAQLGYSTAVKRAKTKITWHTYHTQKQPVGDLIGLQSRPINIDGQSYRLRLSACGSMVEAHSTKHFLIVATIERDKRGYLVPAPHRSLNVSVGTKGEILYHAALVFLTVHKDVEQRNNPQMERRNRLNEYSVVMAEKRTTRKERRALTQDKKSILKGIRLKH